LSLIEQWQHEGEEAFQALLAQLHTAMLSQAAG
jgi:hypothetical protein